MASGIDIFTEIPELDYEEEKVATNPKEFAKVVFSRRSIRVYTDEKIPEEVVSKCIDMALAAPNSSNLQPWEFYRVVDPVRKKLLIEYCMNQPAARTAAELFVAVARRDTWKKHAKQMLEVFSNSGEKIPRSALAYYQKLAPFMYTQGPLGIFGVLKSIGTFVWGLFRPLPREPHSVADMRVWMHKSTALACENLMLALRAHGYDSCPMEGMDSKRIRKLLGLPRQAEITMVISAGKRAKEGVYGPQIRFDKKQFYFEV